MRSLILWLKKLFGMANTVKVQGSKTVARARKGQDGKGIVSQVDYYGLSSASGTRPTSWVAGTPPLMTQTNKYLWKYTRTTYSDGSYTDTTPGIVGVFGDSGLSYRYSKWEEGFEYRNDNNPFYRDDNGKGVVDVVFADDITIWDPATDPNNPPAAWICRQTHTSASARPLPAQGASNMYWTAMNSMAPILTALVLARKIRANEIDVDSLTAKHVQVKDSGDNVIADMGGNVNYPLLLGGSSPSNAKSYFNKAGDLFCNGGTFAGRLKLPFVVIVNYHTLVAGDGTSFILQGSMGDGELYLPANASFNGWLINVFAWPRLSRMDGLGVVSGHILCPKKATISDRIANLYFASRIEMDEAGGFMQFICVDKQWVLINESFHNATYTQSSNSNPDW